MTESCLRALLISDFNVSSFAGYLANDSELPRVEAITTPYGQVVPLLLDENAECWQRQADFAIIWTRPERVITAFADLMLSGRTDIDKLLEQIDEFADALTAIKRRVPFAIIPSWTIPDYSLSPGLLDLKTRTGLGNALMRMNLRLAERVENKSYLHLVNAEPWLRAAGEDAYNPKLWYLAKAPFANRVYQEAVRNVKGAVDGILGRARKLIILDLDDTLWGGIVGDQGWEHLNLGGHDPIGEAYQDFQRGLLALKNRGVLLAIVSKNEESVAREAIEKHPEMVLRMDDFCGWRINWNDKADNIAQLVAELNLGLHSVVFLDDSRVERARVCESLPEVLVPELPADKMLFRKFLMRLKCFDKPSLSQEDLGRTEMYRAERERTSARRQVGSYDDWLQTLGIKVKVEGLKAENLPRVTQLLNKTNQMNLTTRRMTEGELAAWVSPDSRNLWAFRVSDRFGDSGLTGIISLEQLDKKHARIVDFILSCRVMGRQVEQAMLHVALTHARSLSLQQVCLEYLPTAKNKPCLGFLESSELQRRQESNIFEWDLSEDYRLPPCIELEHDNDQS